MAIAIDAIVTGQTATAVSSVTYAHTVAGSNRLLTVMVMLQRSGAATSTISGVTYNGVAMTQATQEHTYSNTILTAVYYLIAPATGANNVVVTLSSAVTTDIVVGSVSLTGVAQTTPLNGTFATGNFSSPATSTLTTTQANSWLIGSLYTYVASTAGTGETKMYGVTVNANSIGAGFYKPVTTAGSQTLSEALTGGPADWSYSAAAFAPATTTVNTGAFFVLL